MGDTAQAVVPYPQRIRENSKAKVNPVIPQPIAHPITYEK